MSDPIDVAIVVAKVCGGVVSVVGASVGAMKLRRVLATKEKNADGDLATAKLADLNERLSDIERGRERSQAQRKRLFAHDAESDERFKVIAVQHAEWLKLSNSRALELQKLRIELDAWRAGSEECNKRGEATQRDLDRLVERVDGLRQHHRKSDGSAE